MLHFVWECENDDDDGDGVANGLEYLLGGTGATNDLAKLPEVSTAIGNLVFIFVRGQASIDGVTPVAIEVGENDAVSPGHGIDGEGHPAIVLPHHSEDLLSLAF